jgi:hypothetical protein
MGSVMHVLGMAKSFLDLKGCKGPKLELDFFKLVYAASVIRSKGEHAYGYLLALNQSVYDRAHAWIAKYQTGDTVMILLATPDPEELALLAAEKIRNALGMLPDAVGAGDALASVGEELGEGALAKEIRRLHPAVQQVTDRRQFPQGVRWDFYGTGNG